MIEDYDELDYVDDDFYYPEKHCHCGEKKRIQDTFCNSCQKAIIDIFKDFMSKNFDREELEYLNDVLDGEYIPDYILGREE